MPDWTVGDIRMFAGGYAPQGWELCHGQLLSTAQYNDLFALIGKTYGGDGETTFALPDLRGRLPMGESYLYPLGTAGGTEEVRLTQWELPPHKHSLFATASEADLETGAEALPANGRDVTPYVELEPRTAMSVRAVKIAGRGAPHTNLQPYLCLNFIIAVGGEIPREG